MHGYGIQNGDGYGVRMNTECAWSQNADGYRMNMDIEWI